MSNQPHLQFVNRPDFPNLQNYEFVIGLSNREMAWEFLRRNAEFCKHHKEWNELNRKCAQEIMDYPLSMPSHEFAKCHSTLQEKLDKKRGELCERFGLAKGTGGLHFDAGAPGVFEDLGPIGAIYLCQWVDGVKIPMFEDEPLKSQLCMDIRIVAEESIEQQLRDIVAYYHAMKRHSVGLSVDESLKKSRRQLDKYPTYLLVFDAFELGFSITEIADVLRPKSKNFDDRKAAHDYVSKSLKAATELVNGGYLKIAAHDFRK